jgi:hypothetical protein
LRHRAVPVRLAAAIVLLGAATAAAAPLRVAVQPPIGLAPSEAPFVERALVAAVQSLPELVLANVGPAGRLMGARGPGIESTARAQALGRESGAALVLVSEAARLGDRIVLYLQGIEVAGGASIGTAAASLAPTPGEPAPADRAALRTALARVLLPERYVGRLKLRVDVGGAELHVDGKRTALSAEPLELPVGKHALRVTHPAYRDFLRFVDIDFDRTLAIEVPLTAYPRAEGEMAERARRQAAAPQGATNRRTWRWWVLGAASLVLIGVTAGIVVATRPGIESDRSVDYRALPRP